MSVRLLSLAALPLLTSGARGQAFVSPTQTAQAEGGSSSFAPFLQNRPARYLQIHGDISLGGPLAIQRIGFRQDAGSNATFTGTTALDVELFMGTTAVSYGTPSLDFLGNYTGKRFLKISRKVVNWRPQGQSSSSGPNPFKGMDLPLDTPFPFFGGTLVWEVVFYSGIPTGTLNLLDAHFGSTTKATSTVTGPGCMPVGNSSAMVLDIDCHDNAGFLGFGPTVITAPPNSPCVFAIGTSNPSLSVPGLCSPLSTSLDIVLPMGSTNEPGRIKITDSFGFFVPNTAPGLTLFTQVHALEPARPEPFKVCNSHGVATKLPPVGASSVVKVTRLFADLPDAPRAVFSANTSVGGGLVTRFD